MKRPPRDAGSRRTGRGPDDRRTDRTASDADRPDRDGGQPLGRRDAKRLLHGAVPPSHAAVAALLAAAAGPPEPRELAGERAALAAFRDTPRPAGARRRRWRSLTAKAFLVKVAVGVTAVLAGGVAVAGTSVLLNPAPDRTPRIAPVETPQSSAAPGASPARSPAAPPRPSLVLDPSSSAPAPRPTGRLVGPCRAWQEVQRDPGAPALTAEQAGAIAAAADRRPIAALCAAVLAGDGADLATEGSEEAPARTPEPARDGEDESGNAGNGRDRPDNAGSEGRPPGAGRPPTGP